MSLRRRLCALLTTIAMTAMSADLAAAPSAEAATKPTITRLASKAGPLAQTRVVVYGTNLGSAKAVKFGKKKGSITRKLSSTAIEVRTPRGARAGTVYVQVQVGKKWTAKNSTARYTFAAVPKITKLSVQKGLIAGGQQVKISGSGLALTSSVSFGSAAASVVSRASRSVTVNTPAGVPGATAVRVVTPGGNSKSLTFTYVSPPTADKVAVTPVAAATAASQVEWVTGGPDLDGDVHAPWTVGLPAGSAVPQIGSQFVIKPGNSTFVTGLAGTVSDVAVQADDSVRVQVSPTELTAAFDRLTLEYAGKPDMSRRVDAQGRLAPSATRPGGAEAGRSTEFSIKGLTPVVCTKDDGASVAFGVDLTMTVSDVDVSQRLDLGGIGRAPSFDASLTTEIKTTGKITVAAKATCKLRQVWSESHRVRIPLGTTGMTISFGPSFEFKATSKGTWSIVNRTRTTYSMRAEYGKQPSISKASRTVENKQGGESTFKLEVTAGVSIQAGILDRAGFQGKLLLGVSAKVEVKQLSVCVEGSLFLKLTVGLFLDLIVARWESNGFEGKVDLLRLEGCVSADAPVTSDEPEITTGRLPDAWIGQGYTGWLTVADDRPGTWTAVKGLPTGLRVDAASGKISGTPSGPVADSLVVVDFRDNGGKVATTIVRIMVYPSPGIRGGDLQATLQWTGPADLDLHVLDPDGDEIYYSNPTSQSGGQLDKDANAGCNGEEDDDNAVENIYWPPRSAPVGRYVVWVKVYAECEGPLDWHLTVRRNGVVVLDERGNGDSDGYAVTVGGQGASAAGKTVGVPDRKRGYPAK